MGGNVWISTDNSQIRILNKLTVLGVQVYKKMRILNLCWNRSLCYNLAAGGGRPADRERRVRGVAREGGDHGPALPRDDVRRLQGRRQGLLQGGQRGALDGQAAGRKVSVHCTVENYEGPGMHSFKEALLGKIWDFMLRLRGVSTFLNMHVTMSHIYP